MDDGKTRLPKKEYDRLLARMAGNIGAGWMAKYGYPLSVTEAENAHRCVNFARAMLRSIGITYEQT